MARDRVDTLDRRVRRLRAAIEALDEEHAAVREKVRTIEDALDGSPASAGGSTGREPPADSATPEPEDSEASDEEVAAAVRAVEDSRKKGRDTDPLVL